MVTRRDDPRDEETRWPAKVGRGVTEVATVVAGAFGILGLFRSLEAAIGVFAVTFALGIVVAGLAQFGATLVDETARGIGRRFAPRSRLRHDAPWPLPSESRPPAPPLLRKVSFRSAAPVAAGASRLATMAAEAVFCKDLLTRRTLEPGAEVFLCLGRDGRCGAAFPRDLRADLAAHGENRCPACGEAGRFADATLPFPANAATPELWARETAA